MPLNTYALTTLDRTKTFLGITTSSNDTLLTNLINSATDFIEKYCNRRFQLTAYTNEVYDGTGNGSLVLNQYPVSSTATFTLQVRDSIENTNTFSTENTRYYYIDYNPGIVRRVVGKFYEYPRHYQVTYSAGYNYDNATIFLSDVGAGDLEMACWKLVGKIYLSRVDNTNIRSESIGDYSVTYAREAQADKEVSDILMAYRKPQVH